MNRKIFGVVFLMVAAGACGGSTTNGAGGSTSGTGGSTGSTQASTIGDPCKTDTDCGSGFQCMADHPDGYCIKPCDHTKGDADCPSGSICQWDGTAGECHKECTAQSDCRTGYECAPASTDPTNTASHAFCDVAGSMSADGGMP